MFSIRSFSMPAGTRTSTTSPTFLFRRAWAMGDLMDIFPSRMLASWGLAMIYIILALLAKLVISTLLSSCTQSLPSFDMSTTLALASTFCLNCILLSSRACSRFAA